MHVEASLFRVGGLLAALLALGACQSTPSPSSSSASTSTADPGKVELSHDVNATAEVIGVQKETRTVMLRRQDGAMVSVHASPEVRNFDQIGVGDQLRVRYGQKLSVERAPASASTKDVDVALAGARTPAGGRPGAGVGVSVRTVVTIESIDLPHDIVVFSLPSGELAAHKIATPDGRTFVQKLKLGDKVEILYSEALAISVERL